MNIFYSTIFNILIYFYKLFNNNLGLAVIILAIIYKLLFIPIMEYQKSNAKKAQALQSEIKSLQETAPKTKDKSDDVMLQKDLAALQGRALGSTVVGCLPIILSFIFIINLSNSVRDFVNIKNFEITNPTQIIQDLRNDPTFVVNYDFLGINLSKTAIDIFNNSESIVNNAKNMLPYIILAIFVGVTQYFSFKLMQKSNPAPSTKVTNPDKKPSEMEQMLLDSGKATAFMIPIMTMVTSIGLLGGSKFFPAAVSLFWTVQNLFSIIQELISQKRLK